MAAPDPTQARFTSVARKAGHYESFYLKACHPSGGLGVWIRYTVHKRPGAEPLGSLWFTLFDAEAGRPYAVKATLPGPSAGGEDWLAVGDAAIGPGRATGAAAGEGREASWELRFEAPERPLFHMPSDWMYGAPVPRTKLLSPAPAARFDGRVEAGGRQLELAGWRGMIGHNWGSQHAERWVWLHGLGFDGAGEGTWLDAALGRVKLGPLTTPWVGNGALSLDGERLALGGPGRKVEVHERPESCDFLLSGKGVRVRGSVSAPRERFVGWVYADPDGSEHNTLNCSIADMRLAVERDGGPPLTLSVSGGAAYEFGMRERDHGMEIEPFGDGQP
jgi:hypothetical protein